MKLEKREGGGDLGFQIPDAGWHSFEVQEGIEVFSDEDSQRKSLRMPLQIIDEEADLSWGDFTTMTMADGSEFRAYKRKMELILSVTGLFDAFCEKLPDDVTVYDKKFTDALAMKLPGVKFDGKVDHRKYKTSAGQERVQADLSAIKPYKEGGARDQSKGAAKSSNQSSTGSTASDDWV